MMAASIATAAPAAASPLVCAGTQDTAFVCVDPQGKLLADDCVYVGPPPCIPVVVWGPQVYCGGALMCNL